MEGVVKNEVSIKAYHGCRRKRDGGVPRLPNEKRYTTDTQEKQMLLQMTHLKKTADSLLFGVLLQGKLPHVCFVLDTIASPSRHV